MCGPRHRRDEEKKKGDQPHRVYARPARGAGDVRRHTEELSGGEKTIATLALLFAIHRYTILEPPCAVSCNSSVSIAMSSLLLVLEEVDATYAVTLMWPRSPARFVPVPVPSSSA